MISVTSSAPDSRAAPIKTADRLVHVDVVRGFALLGILIVNIWAFQVFLLGWRDRFELAAGSSIDTIAAWFIYLFAADKFWSSFAFLFGLGFVLLTERLERRGVSWRPLYLRRQLILLGIGMLHMLLWPPDILRIFAVFGVLLIWVRKLPVRLLPVLAMLLITTQQIPHWISVLDSAEQSATEVVHASFEASSDGESTELRRARIYQNAHGGLREVVRENLSINKEWYWTPLMWFELLGIEFAFMLLGVYAGRKRLFESAGKHLHYFRSILKWGLIIALLGQGVAMLTWAYAAHPSNPGWIHILRDFSWAYGSGALAIAYIAGLTLLAHKPAWTQRLAVVGSAGRLALTNYLLQTLVATSLLYGFGAGLAPRVGPAESVLLAFAIFGAQALGSHYWLRYFRFGPAEWLWRSLTYGHRQPLRIRTGRSG